MKKVFAMILALGILGVFAAGCSGGGDAAAPDAGKAGDAGKTGENKAEGDH